MHQALQLEAPIEAPGKGTEIAPQVPGANRMVGSLQGILDISQCGVDPVELGDLNTGWPATGDQPLMRADRSNGAEAAQPVGDHGATYLVKVGIDSLSELSPAVLSAFVIESCRCLSKNSISGLCSSLRVFLRYLHREGCIARDLAPSIEGPQKRRLSNLPRSIGWDEVRRMLEAVDRRSAVGKRDYAILLLLVTYGLRAREVAALTLDDIDWDRERLLVPERKAGHCTAYPLSTVVGEAVLDYLQHARPKITGREIFFRVLAPRIPITYNAVADRATLYLRKAGIQVRRAGSHTLRHTCVQRLIDAEFPLKVIGDYVGHGSPRSTEVYSKVAIETLREVAMGDGEALL